MDTKYHGHSRSYLLFGSTTTSHETIQNKSSQQKLFHKERIISFHYFSCCIYTYLDVPGSEEIVSKWVITHRYKWGIWVAG